MLYNKKKVVEEIVEMYIYNLKDESGSMTKVSS